MKRKEQIAGRYKLLRELGEGAMGVTFLAEDALLGRRVVIKVPQHLGMAEWFLKEACAQAAVNHANAVKVFDAGMDDGTPYIVQEWIAGWDLNKLLSTVGSLSPVRATQILASVAEAVAHAHAAGIVHRDIKPQNILIGSDDIPRLADFGIAKMAWIKTTQAGDGMGTKGFCAPEQFADAKTSDHRADIYSLGWTFLAMLSGQAFPPHERIVELVPDTYREFLYKCVAHKPADRFQTVEAMLEALPVDDFGHRRIRGLGEKRGTPKALKHLKSVGGAPIRKRDRVELIFRLGDVRVSPKGERRTIAGYGYLPKRKEAVYVIWLHEKKKFDVKRAIKAMTEYSPTIDVDHQIIGDCE